MLSGHAQSGRTHRRTSRNHRQTGGADRAPDAARYRIGWLKSIGHRRYSTIETWVEDVLQVPVSRGYLAKLCTGIISASLQDAYQELSDTIPTQQQLGSDETSIKDNGKKQSRSVVSFRQESIPAKLAGEPAPSLLG